MEIVVHKNYITTSKGLLRNGYCIYVIIGDEECSYWIPVSENFKGFDLEDIRECFSLIDNEEQMNAFLLFFRDFSWEDLDNELPVFAVI